MITLVFLGALAAFILGGARLAIWTYDQSRRDASRTDDWSMDEWWR